MKPISLKKYVPGIAWFFLVMILMCMPGNELPQDTWISKIPASDKLIHTGLFAVLCFLFCLPFYKSALPAAMRKQQFNKVLMAAVVLGITIEFIQRFWIPGRSFDLWDWAADSLGAFLGCWIARKFLLRQ